MEEEETGWGEGIVGRMNPMAKPRTVTNLGYSKQLIDVTGGVTETERQRYREGVTGLCVMGTQESRVKGDMEARAQNSSCALLWTSHTL